MNNFFRILFLSGFVCLTNNVSAQTFEDYKARTLQDFNAYRDEQWRQFKEYRDKVNAEFAEYMRHSWVKRESEPAIPMPERPEPPKPVVKDPKQIPAPDSLPLGKIIPSSQPVQLPQPVVPIPDVVVPVHPSFSFDFYGTRCNLALEEAHRFVLKGVDENKVADAWQILSKDRFLPVVAGCLAWRDKLRLCDWGYVRFVEHMTAAFFGKEQQNEAQLLQMFLLTQSGYKVRIARTGERLVVLLPSKDEIYEYSYLNLKGEKYYVVDPSLRQCSFHVFEREFPGEQFFSLQIPFHPLLDVDPSEPRRLTSRRYPALSVEVTVNRNLIAFYDDFPQSNAWDMYVQASLDDKVKDMLYPALRQAIAGKSKPEAANILINFVQTAFEYQTDQKQFGGERAFFPDETLYYPYSDCEDRAILYAVLARELLNLEVVLLHYPKHLATAVCFDEEVPGDYFMLDGRKYLVCDPTYINADIGEAMPQYKQTQAQVIRLGREK